MDDRCESQPVGALNGEPDYAKTRNYWKYLKAKLKREKPELVSATTQLKLAATDGKRYKRDALDADGIVALGFNKKKPHPSTTEPLIYKIS